MVYSLVGVKPQDKLDNSVSFIDQNNCDENQLPGMK